jgi:hypothetical protein
MHERQHAGDAVVPLDLQEMAGVAEAALDHLFPASAMEKSRIGGGMDETVPRRGVVQ